MTTQSSGNSRVTPLQGTTAYQRWGKRVLDVVVAAVALVVVSPILVVLAAAVAATLGRPVLFRQRRVGLGGDEFTCLKFRSMHPDRRVAAVGQGPVGERRVTHKSAADPRLSRVGRFMRMASLDELPQLVNVLRGEMSVVGPRPELPAVVARYEPWQHCRHAVKPGMTGLWQVSARGDVDMHHATEIDLDYIARMSLRTDLSILARTIPALLIRRGK